MNVRRLTLSIILPCLLCGCPTVAERQFQAMRTGNEQANAEMRTCLTTAYNAPNVALIRAHLPMNVDDLTLQQLADQARATSSEAQAIFMYHSDIQRCRKVFLASRARSEPALVPILISAYNKGDDDLLSLAQRQISWGEYLHRARDRAVETRAALQAANREVMSELRREDEAERERRQRAAEALAAWAQTQEMINAANRPVITNCSGFGAMVNCVSH